MSFRFFFVLVCVNYYAEHSYGFSKVNTKKRGREWPQDYKDAANVAIDEINKIEKNEVKIVSNLQSGVHYQEGNGIVYDLNILVNVDGGKKEIKCSNVIIKISPELPAELRNFKCHAKSSSNTNSLISAEEAAGQAIQLINSKETNEYKSLVNILQSSSTQDESGVVFNLDLLLKVDKTENEVICNNIQVRVSPAKPTELIDYHCQQENSAVKGLDYELAAQKIVKEINELESNQFKVLTKILRKNHTLEEPGIVYMLDIEVKDNITGKELLCTDVIFKIMKNDRSELRKYLCQPKKNNMDYETAAKAAIAAINQEEHEFNIFDSVIPKGQKIEGTGMVFNLLLNMKNVATNELLPCRDVIVKVDKDGMAELRHYVCQSPKMRIDRNKNDTINEDEAAARAVSAINEKEPKEVKVLKQVLWHEFRNEDSGVVYRLNLEVFVQETGIEKICSQVEIKLEPQGSDELRSYYCEPKVRAPIGPLHQMTVPDYMTAVRIVMDEINRRELHQHKILKNITWKEYHIDRNGVSFRFHIAAVDQKSGKDIICGWIELFLAPFLPPDLRSYHCQYESGRDTMSSQNERIFKPDYTMAARSVLKEINKKEPQEKKILKRIISQDSSQEDGGIVYRFHMLVNETKRNVELFCSEIEIKIIVSQAAELRNYNCSSRNATKTTRLETNNRPPSYETAANLAVAEINKREPNEKKILKVILWNASRAEGPAMVYRFYLGVENKKGERKICSEVEIELTPNKQPRLRSYRCLSGIPNIFNNQNPDFDAAALASVYEINKKEPKEEKTLVRILFKNYKPEQQGILYHLKFEATVVGTGKEVICNNVIKLIPNGPPEMKEYKCKPKTEVTDRLIVSNKVPQVFGYKIPPEYVSAAQIAVEEINNAEEGKQKVFARVISGYHFTEDSGTVYKLNIACNDQATSRKVVCSDVVIKISHNLEAELREYRCQNKKNK